MLAKKRWTASEDDSIRSLWPNFRSPFVAERLGRSEAAVKWRAAFLGVDSGRNRELDENFFKTWTPDMAYVLGYLWADGTVTEKSIAIECNDSDQDIIYWIRDQFKSNHKIKYRKRITPSGYEAKMCSCSFASTAMVRDLHELHGMESAKSRKDLPWPKVPDDMLPHFVRGNLDGDGSINILERSRVDGPCFKCSFILLGTKCWLDGLSDQICSITGLEKPNLCRLVTSNGLLHQIYLGKKSDLRTLYHWVYPSEDIFCLERKRNKLRFVVRFNDEYERMKEEDRMAKTNKSSFSSVA